MGAEKKAMTASLVALSGVDLGPVLHLECSGCKKTRDVEPDEIGPLDFPMCDECYMPMMPVKVTEG